MGCCLVFMATKFCKEFEDEKKKVVWFKCCIIWLGKPVPEWHQVTMIAGQGPDGIILWSRGGSHLVQITSSSYNALLEFGSLLLSDSFVSRLRSQAFDKVDGLVD